MIGQGNITIDSLANIFQSKQYICTEFIKKNNNYKFGIKIYNENKENSTFYLFTNNIIKYIRNKHKNNDIFNPLILNKEYKDTIKSFNNSKNLSSNYEQIKQFYIKKPYCSIKENFSIGNNKWKFLNIYGNYFCFCKGLNCLNSPITQDCKYRFYLSIIEDNKNIYRKTDYLFADFFSSDKSNDDAYPIFKEMIKQNLSAHYMDDKKSINCNLPSYLSYLFIYRSPKKCGDTLYPSLKKIRQLIIINIKY